MFNVSIALKENKVLGELVVDSYFFVPSKYDYAFYLFQDDLRVDTQGYSDDMNVIFGINEMIGTFSIKVFIRDKEHDDKRSFYSEKIYIDS